MFLMVKCDVLSEVRTEFLNIIHMSVEFKGLMRIKMPVISCAQIKVKPWDKNKVSAHVNEW
jgi:hypothetical protein